MLCSPLLLDSRQLKPGVSMQYHLIIGNQAYSSWSLRGWLLLRAFNIEFEHEVVPLYVPEYDEFLARNYPSRTVPTLRVNDDGNEMMIWDSLAMAEFLHEQHPEAGIWPTGIAERAAARSFCAEMHSGFDALRSTMPMNVRREYKTITPDTETRADIDRIEDLWRWARSNWGGGGRYLFGEHFCAADAFFAPVASRLRTYQVSLKPESQCTVEALLNHPATVEFYEAGKRETWVLEFNEFDQG